MFKKYFSSLLFLVILLSGLIVSLKLVSKNQEIRERAQTVTELPEELIIPGEAIIKYKEGNTPEEIEEKVDKRSEKRSKNFLGKVQVSLEDLAIKATGDTVPETKLAQIEKAEKDLQVKATKRLTEPKDKKETQLDSIQLVKTEDETSFSEIKSRHDSVKAVEYVLPNLKAEITVAPNDTLYSQMWGLQKIDAEDAWDITKGSNDVTVAIIDTGIDYTHNDLGNSSSSNSFNNLVVGGYDFINNDSAPLDDNGHGTHIAGTIGALTNNGQGVSGVNWNVKLMAVKVLSAGGSGDWFTILDGIIYAANSGAKVINMSLGSTSTCSSFSVLQDTIDYARSQGVTVIVAAGNNNIDAANFMPASCNGVITVGATTSSDTRALFSNFGSAVDIAAPGQGILSTWLQEGFNTMDGTSMASPHVAGAAALLLAKNPNLTPDQIEQLLKNNGDEITTDLAIGKRLNLYKSLLAVGTTPTPSQPPTPTPTAIPTATPTLTLPTPTSTLTPSPTQPPVTPTPTGALPPANGGDTNGDGVVDQADFNNVKDNFGSKAPAEGTPADLDQDGDVDIYDFNKVIENFGRLISKVLETLAFWK